MPRASACEANLALKAALRTYWSARFGSHPYDYVARLPLAQWLLRQTPATYRRHLQKRFFTGGTGLAGAIHRADLDASYYAADESDQLRATREMWGGAPGIAWHEDKRSRFENDPAFRAKYLLYRDPIVRALEVLVRTDPRFTKLCEIGTGNGIFAAHLAARLPQLQVVGLDLSAEQIEQNRHIYADTGIEFRFGEALGWVKHDATPGTIVVACGTLECLTEAELERLLRAGRDRLHPVAIALVEPINIDLATVKDSQPRGVMTFSHNYPILLERCGFDVRSMELTPIDPSVRHYHSVALIAVSRSST